MNRQSVRCARPASGGLAAGIALKAAVGAARPVEIIDACGSSVAIKRWGHGVPVLCLHAIGHGSGDFASMASRLGNHFEIVAVDWPGHGHSPDDGRPMRPQHFAELALAVVDRLRLTRPIVVGNSIGGAAALIAAATVPEAFAAVVLCNAGGLAPVDRTARLATSLMAWFFEAGAREAKWFPAAFGFYYRCLVLPRAAAKEQRRNIISAGSAAAPLLADAWRGFGEPDADLRALAPHVAAPVWLAWAQRDRFVSWRRSRAAAETFRRRRVTQFNAGHSAFMEEPDRFAAEFAQFIAETVQERQ